MFCICRITYYNNVTKLSFIILLFILILSISIYFFKIENFFYYHLCRSQQKFKKFLETSNLESQKHQFDAVKWCLIKEKFGILCNKKK